MTIRGGTTEPQFTALRDSRDLTLVRPAPSDQWHVPATIRVEGERLLWTLANRAGPRIKQVRAGEGLLEQFVGLQNATPDDILSFAREWGVLYLCKHHNLPASHNIKKFKPADRLSTAYFNQCELNWLKRGKEIWYSEPVELWRKYAREAQALLQVANSLHSNALGNLKDWQSLFAKPYVEKWIFDKDKPESDKLCEAKLLVSCKLSDWLDLGGVRITPYWCIGDPALAFGSRRLFGGLALQLTFAVVRTEAFAQCSSCATFYVPTRRPRAGQRNYCQKCRDKGRPQADAARDWNRKNRPRNNRG